MIIARYKRNNISEYQNHCLACNLHGSSDADDWHYYGSLY